MLSEIDAYASTGDEFKFQNTGLPEFSKLSLYVKDHPLLPMIRIYVLCSDMDFIFLIFILYG